MSIEQAIRIDMQDEEIVQLYADTIMFNPMKRAFGKAAKILSLLKRWGIEVTMLEDFDGDSGRESFLYGLCLSLKREGFLDKIFGKTYFNKKSPKRGNPTRAEPSSSRSKPRPQVALERQIYALILDRQRLERRQREDQEIIVGLEERLRNLQSARGSDLRPEDPPMTSLRTGLRREPVPRMVSHPREVLRTNPPTPNEERVPGNEEVEDLFTDLERGWNGESVRDLRDQEEARVRDQMKRFSRRR